MKIFRQIILFFLIGSVLFSYSAQARRVRDDLSITDAISENIQQRESKTPTVTAESGFVGYVEANRLNSLLESVGGAQFGVESVMSRLSKPYRDFRDVQYAYKIQEDLVSSPEILEKINQALKEIGVLFKDVLSPNNEWPQSQTTYDAQTEKYIRILVSETGELSKALITLRSSLEGFNSPEAARVLKTIDQAITRQREIFSPDNIIFQRWKYERSPVGDYVYSRAPELGFDQKDFIETLQGDLALLAGSCILAKVRQNFNYNSAIFGNGDLLLRVSGAVNPVIKVEGEFDPISFAIDNNSKITVLSGLNTGGKSVLMKTVGLIALMVQAAIPVPGDVFMNEGMFSSFVRQGISQYDIASGVDSQFSADLKNSSHLVEEAQEGSFVIIDDDLFGGSSEPAITASCFAVTVEKLKEKGAVVLAVSHQLQGLELLKEWNPDIRFLKVVEERQADGLYTSTYEFEPGIAASSHGLQETIRSNWPAARQALKYFNLIAQANGLDAFEYSGRLGPKNVKPSKYRGYFYSNSEREFLEVEDTLTLLSRELRNDDVTEQQSFFDDGTKDKGDLFFASEFMRDAISHPDQIDGSRWSTIIQALIGNPNLLEQLDTHLKDMERRYSPERLLELLSFCRSNGINALGEESLLKMQSFIQNTEENNRFNNYVRREGLKDGMAMVLNRFTPTDLEKEFCQNICAFYALSAVTNFFKEQEQGQWCLAEPGAKGQISIKNGWHTSIVDSPDKTPNNVNIERSGGGGSLSIYTGFNTGGKSTLAKMIAQIVVLAKIGLPVPAESAIIGDFSDIQVISRSLVEQERLDYRRGRQQKGTLEILLNKSGLAIQNATSNSLIILDEPFSGCTEPMVATSLTAALAEELTRRGATVILITHMLEAIPLLVKNVPNTLCFQAETYENDQGITKPRYSFVDGIAESSQGLEVARGIGWFGYERALEYFEELTKRNTDQENNTEDEE